MPLFLVLEHIHPKIDGDRVLDDLDGETSHVDVANACVEALFNDSTINKDLSIVNEGDRLGNTDWEQLFTQL